MLKIPALKAEETYILDEHHEWADEVTYTIEGPAGERTVTVAAGELPELREGERLTERDRERRGVKDGAPVFVYKPLEVLEAAEWATRVRKDGRVAYAHLAHERLLRVEGLEIGDVPFNRETPGHLGRLDPVWLIELGEEALERTRLDKIELGKSSSPSASSS